MDDFAFAFPMTLPPGPPPGFAPHPMDLQPPGPPGFDERTPLAFSSAKSAPGVPNHPLDLIPMKAPPGFPPQDLISVDEFHPVGGFPRGLPPNMPPGLPPNMPPGGPGPPPGGFPPGMPPSFGPADGSPFGMPPWMPPGMPPGLPPGLPPGMPPGMPDGMSIGEAPSSLGPPPKLTSAAPPSLGPPPSSDALPVLGHFGPPSDFLARAAPADAADGAAERKQKRGVEGLASNKRIRNGGAVTVYTGYSAITAAPQARAADPKAGEQKPAQAPAQAPTGILAKEALARQLPEGWEMKSSRSTGKVYYINEKLGKSQFDPPAGSTLKTAAPAKKQKVSTRPREYEDAQQSSMSSVKGLIRATDSRASKWSKWQKTSRILNAPEEDAA